MIYLSPVHNSLLASLPAGTLFGLAFLALCTGVCVSLSWFATLAVLKAFRLRTKRWIVLGSFGGLFMLACWVCVVGIMVVALADIHEQATAKPAGGSASKVPQNLQGQVRPYLFTLPEGWQMDWDSKEFDFAAQRGKLHLGIVASRSVGSAQTIADMARAKILQAAPTARFGQTAPVDIDGQSWLSFTADFYYPEAKKDFSYLYHVYSGGEGMFQVVGWSSETLPDRDADTLREIAASFRFPSHSGRSNFTEPAPALTEAQTLAGTHIAYQLTAPAGWEVQRATGRDGYDVSIKRELLRVGVIAEQEVAASREELLRFVQRRLQRQEGTTTLDPVSAVRIDSREWLHFVAQNQTDQSKILQDCYIYAGPEGAFQIIGMTPQAEYARNEAAIREVATSFRFPPQVGATPRTVQGKVQPYTLTLPAHWRARYSDGIFDLLASGEGLYVAVSAEESALPGTTLQMDRSLRGRLQRMNKDIQFGETSGIKIDGRDWLQFTARYQTDGLDLVYHYFFYVGEAKTYQITAWTQPESYGKNAGLLEKVATSFRFPPDAAPTLGQASQPPSPSPDATVPSKKARR